MHGSSGYQILEIEQSAPVLNDQAKTVKEAYFCKNHVFFTKSGRYNNATAFIHPHDNICTMNTFQFFLTKVNTINLSIHLQSTNHQAPSPVVAELKYGAN
jgi:hypothetical protein